MRRGWEQSPGHAVAVSALCSLFAMSIASCSSDMDGYRLKADLGDGNGGDRTSGFGGDGGDFSGTGASVSSNGGVRGDGSGGSGKGGNGNGKGGNGKGGNGVGGNGEGGNGEGGASLLGTGGAAGGFGGTGGLGGTGGTASGGVANAGGAPNTGGAQTTGGAQSTGGSGGTWPHAPVVLAPDSAPVLSGITAAAWEPISRHFFLLAPAAKQVYEVDPSTTPAHVTAPFTIAATSVQKRAFGASASYVYVVADNEILRLPRAGGAASSVPVAAPTSLNAQTGAYAKGWFVLGDITGATQAVSDAATAPDASAKSLMKVHGIVTDGASFAFSAQSASGLDTFVHRMDAGTFALNAAPCKIAGNVTMIDEPVAVYGNTVAWVTRPQAGPTSRLRVATLIAGTCGVVSDVYFGAGASTGSGAVGLLNDRYAIVVPASAGSSVTLALLDNVSQTQIGASAPSISLSGGLARTFVMGATLGSPTLYGVLLSDDKPALLGF